MAWKKEDSEKKVLDHRAKELAMRAQFKNVKSATPQGVIEKGSATPSHGKIG